MDSFSKWFKDEEAKAHEVTTSTGEVAHFSRRIGEVGNTRMFPEPVLMKDTMKDIGKKKWKEFVETADSIMKQTVRVL